MADGATKIGGGGFGLGLDLRQLAQGAAAQLREGMAAAKADATAGPRVSSAAIAKLSQGEADQYFGRLGRLLSRLPLGHEFYDPKLIGSYIAVARQQNASGELPVDVMIHQQTGLPISGVWVSAQSAQEHRASTYQSRDPGDLFESSDFNDPARVSAAASNRTLRFALRSVENCAVELVDYDPSRQTRTFRVNVDSLSSPPLFQRICLEIVQGRDSRDFERAGDGSWVPSKKLAKRLADLATPPFRARFVALQQELGDALQKASCSSVGPSWFVGSGAPSWAAQVVRQHPGSMVLSASVERFERTGPAGRAPPVEAEAVDEQAFFAQMGWSRSREDLFACPAAMQGELREAIPDGERESARIFTE